MTDEIEEAYKQSEASQRLAMNPGAAMLSATIIAAMPLDVDNFGWARDCVAWLGRRPKPHSTGSLPQIFACEEQRPEVK